MTTDSTKAMTLEQVRDKLRQYEADSVEYYSKTRECLELTIAEELADAIDAHLAPREVTVSDAVAWRVMRDKDPTFPRLFNSIEAANACVRWVTLPPFANAEPLYALQAAPQRDVTIPGPPYTAQKVLELRNRLDDRLRNDDYAISLAVAMLDEFRDQLLHADRQRGGGVVSDGMLSEHLVPHAKEWYTMCERAAYVDKISISGQLAEAIVKALLAQRGQVPDQPDKALLISMACRHRHDFGLLDRRAQESIIHSMHQLWEEVSGRGFYDETKRESYLAMLSQRGEVKGG